MWKKGWSPRPAAGGCSTPPSPASWEHGTGAPCPQGSPLELFFYSLGRQVLAGVNVLARVHACSGVGVRDAVSVRVDVPGMACLGGFSMGNSISVQAVSP